MGGVEEVERCAVLFFFEIREVGCQESSTSAVFVFTDARHTTSRNNDTTKYSTYTSHMW
jgi:hypothetical protein